MIAYLSLLPTLILALHILSLALPRRLSQLAVFLARAIASFLALALCAAYGVVSSLFLRVIGYGGLGQWTTARAFKWTMWVSTGVSFEIVEGAEHLTRRPAVFVGNHQSELDVLLLGYVMPKYCSVTAKKSLSYYPILGWFMRASKTVFIDRANRQTARAAFDDAADHMRNERQSVFIFPEGTRSYASKPELLPFKKGAFHLAVQAQVPIVPIVAENYNFLLSFREKRFSGGKIRVVVLPPIETTGMTKEDVDDLTLKTQESTIKVLERLYRDRSGENVVVTETRNHNNLREPKKEL